MDAYEVEKWQVSEARQFERFAKTSPDHVVSIAG
jgi:hypothetical protein